MIKIGFLECYLVIPIKRLLLWGKSKINFNCKLNRFMQQVLKFWYCGHCCKYHSARVVAFDYSDEYGDMTCSLGIPVIIEDTKEDGYFLELEEFIPYIAGYMASADEISKIKDKLKEEVKE